MDPPRGRKSLDAWKAARRCIITVCRENASVKQRNQRSHDVPKTTSIGDHNVPQRVHSALAYTAASAPECDEAEEKCIRHRRSSFEEGSIPRELSTRMDAKRESQVHQEEGIGRLPLTSQTKVVHSLALRLAGLEVVEEDLEAGSLGTVVGDDDARAADDLAGLAVAVDLRETSPLAEDLGVRDLDELDVVLGAEGLNELRVLSYGVSPVVPCNSLPRIQTHPQ